LRDAARLRRRPREGAAPGRPPHRGPRLPHVRLGLHRRPGVDDLDGAASRGNAGRLSANFGGRNAELASLRTPHSPRRPRMSAYRTTTKIKLGLIVAAIVIAAASLFYTNALADRVTQQEQSAVRLWVRAIEYQAQTNVVNPHAADFEALGRLLDEAEASGLIDDERAARFADALGWARTMPPTEELDFVFNEIIEPARFNVPAIITDSLTGEVVVWRNVDVDTTASFEE